MSDIFISYASEDRERARAIAEALEQQGWSVWWDRNIPPGKTFSQVIVDALDATKCLVVLWSSKSIVSEWVQNEAAEGARRKIIVPALIEDVAIPFEFRRIQAARLVDWQGQSSHSEFDGFVASIESIAGQPKSKKESIQNAEPQTKLQRPTLEKTHNIAVDSYNDLQKPKSTKHSHIQTPPSGTAHKFTWRNRKTSILIGAVVGITSGSLLFALFETRYYEFVVIFGITNGIAGAIAGAICGKDRRIFAAAIVGAIVASAVAGLAEPADLGYMLAGWSGPGAVIGAILISVVINKFTEIEPK